MAKVSASAISALLRRKGFNPLGSGTPRSREGLRVSQALDRVLVAADLDSSRAATRLIDAVRQSLEEEGCVLSSNPLDSNLIYVQGRTISKNP